MNAHLEMAMPADQHVEIAAETFRMLADPTRIRLLAALSQGEQSVTALAEIVGSQAPAVSRRDADSLRHVAGRRPSLLARCALFSRRTPGAALVAFGLRLGDPVAGFAVTLFILHVGYEVTRDVVEHLMDGVDPSDLEAAEAAASAVTVVRHSAVRARWMGRSLLIKVTGTLSPSLSLEEADDIGHSVRHAVLDAVEGVRQVEWRAELAPDTALADVPQRRTDGEEPSLKGGRAGCTADLTQAQPENAVRLVMPGRQRPARNRLDAEADGESMGS